MTVDPRSVLSKPSNPGRYGDVQHILTISFARCCMRVDSIVARKSSTPPKASILQSSSPHAFVEAFMKATWQIAVGLWCGGGREDADQK